MSNLSNGQFFDKADKCSGCRGKPLVSQPSRHSYRISGEAAFSVLVHDVQAAVRWVRAGVEQFLFGPARIAVWGGSAGVAPGIPERDDPLTLNSGHGHNAPAFWAPGNAKKVSDFDSAL